MQANFPQNVAPQNPMNNQPKPLNNPLNKEQPKKLSKKKLKEIEKQNNILRVNQEYKKMPSNKGQYIIPPVIHYTKLIVDENAKPSEKRGDLYIQYNEYNLNSMENIKTKYNIDENIFIDTGKYKWPELDQEKDLESKQNFKKETKESSKNKEEKPRMFKSMTFDTILESLKKYKNIIPEKYHYAVALSNISITEYLNLQEKFRPYNSVSDENTLFPNMAGIIADDLKEKKINSDKIENIQNKIVIFAKSLSKLKGKSIGQKDGSILIPDNFSLFIILYYLIISKSFWMIFSEKNHGFLTYIIERMFEFIDQDLSEHIEHKYDKKKDTKTIRNNKNENASKENKENITFTNKELMSEILKKYYNYSGDKPDDFHIQQNLELNQLDPNGKRFVKLNEKDIIQDDDDNIVFKLKPNQKFLDDNSLAKKFNKVPQNNIDEIFSFFKKKNNDNDVRAILLLSTASKGLIQYLLVSAIYLIFKTRHSSSSSHNMSDKTGIEGRIQSRIEKGSPEYIYKNRHIIQEANFKKFLLNTRIYRDQIYIQQLSAILKINIHKQVNDYYSGTGSIYKKFLQYVWEEYKTVKTFSKIFE